MFSILQPYEQSTTREWLSHKGDLGFRCLRYIGGGFEVSGVGPEAKQGTYDYIVMTLFPYVE